MMCLTRSQDDLLWNMSIQGAEGLALGNIPRHLVDGVVDRVVVVCAFVLMGSSSQPL